jgi:hypothetical protein
MSVWAVMRIRGTPSMGKQHFGISSINLDILVPRPAASRKAFKIFSPDTVPRKILHHHSRRQIRDAAISF